MIPATGDQICALAAQIDAFRGQIGDALEAARDPRDMLGRAFVGLRVAQDALSDAAALIDKTRDMLPAAERDQ